MIKPGNFAEFITIVFEGSTSSSAAKIVLAEMFSTGGDPSDIIEKRGLTQIHDEGTLRETIVRIIEANSKAVEDYRKGKEVSLQFLIGKAMSELKGRGNPELLKKMLLEHLTK